MSKPITTDTITDFLRGRLNGLDISDFLGTLESDTALRQKFENELAYESLFYSMSWNIQAAPGLEKEADWASLAAPASIVEKERDLDQHTVFEWDTVIRGAFDRAFPLPKDKRKFFRTIPFPKVFRYLAAACIVGAAAGISQLWQSHQNAENPQPAIAISADTSRNHKNVSFDTSGKTGQITSYAFDSIIIISPRALAGKPIFTETHDGIVRIGDKTAILLDKNSSLAVTSESDSAVALDLNRGGALFTVEKHRFTTFSVSTPAGHIAVTGTIFRLAVESDMTIVSVLEGSVKASKRNDTAMVSIDAGMSARILPDTIIVENGDTAATLLYRSGILSDFLHENGVFQNGMFVRSGIAGRRDPVNQDQGMVQDIHDQNHKKP